MIAPGFMARAAGLAATGACARSHVVPDPRDHGQSSACPPYRSVLDWVIEAPDGRFVAFCLMWVDEHHGVSLREPVGTRPDFRRQGLAWAVCHYAMKATKPEGATHVIVNPRGGAMSGTRSPASAISR